MRPDRNSNRGHFANSRRYYRPIKGELLHTAPQTAIAGHRRTCLDARLRVHDLEVSAAPAAPDDKIPSNSGCANNRTAFSCAMSGTQRSSSDAAFFVAQVRVGLMGRVWLYVDGLRGRQQGGIAAGSRRVDAHGALVHVSIWADHFRHQWHNRTGTSCQRTAYGA